MYILVEDDVELSEDNEMLPSLPRLPEVTVDICNRSVQAFIDTGRQITGISSELYEYIKSKIGELPKVAIPAIQIQGAFGSKS